MLEKIIKMSDDELVDIFQKIDKVEANNSEKILNAFLENNICETDFHSTNGYGYNDIGRDKIERVFASVFKAEASLVRSQLISGTHALTTCLFALLRPGDTLLSISGKPYDTLDSVIGFNNNNSSLMAFNINYEQIDLIENDFNYLQVKRRLSRKDVKLVTIQRSKGYSTRESLDINKIEKIVKLIRSVNEEVIIMVDNCYCELVTTREPIEVGVDICVGSLIKNLGGAIASNGGYIVGKLNLVELCAERLNVPGQGLEVGPSMGQNASILKGLYFSPMIVANALKTSIYTAYLFEKLGYKVSPKYNESRADIVQNIIFNDEKKLVEYVRLIQANSKIDSHAMIIPSDMPGYEDKIVMASGSFTQGSSIELSCDGPLRSPYIAYQQGGISYQYGKIIVTRAIQFLLKKY